MEGERKVYVELTARDADGKPVSVTRQERVAGALGALADALDVPVGEGARLLSELGEAQRSLDPTDAAKMVHLAITMFLQALPALDEETQKELTSFAVGERKRFLPTAVSWRLFDKDEVVGNVSQWVSQRSAEELLGVPPLR
jgi:hypothetical protein